MNYYKKQELIKAKKRLDEKKTKTEILQLADYRFITEEEIKEALGFDYIEEPDPPVKEEHIVNEVDYVVKDEVDAEFEENAEYSAQENIKATLIDDSKLEDYPNQPFKSYDKNKKDEMIESIKNFGIMHSALLSCL